MRPGVREVGGAVSVSGRPVASVPRRGVTWYVRRYWLLYLLTVPSYLLVIVFVYLPVSTAGYYSFFQWDGVTSYWLGFNNYIDFASDAALYNSVWNMVRLTVFAVATRLTFPLLVSVLIYRMRNVRAAYWYRTLMVLPMIVPLIVTFLVWKWFYSLEGFVNIVLHAIGQGEAALAWLGEPSIALYALMFIGFPWAGGLAMLIYLAGLQQIPGETIEAAIVDGVGTFSRFFYIELPLVMGQVKLLLALTLIQSLQEFVLPLVVTRGGPGYATMVPGLRLFDVLVGEFQYGYASAIGVALFALILVVTILSQRYLRASTEFEPR